MARRRVDYVVTMQDKLSGKMKKATKSTNRLNSSIKKVGAGLAVYFSGRFVLKALSASLKAFDKQEQALAQVRQGLQSTGGVSKKTFAGLQKQASALQEKTIFGDEDILKNVTSQLLTFTNIAGKEFDRTQQAILDVTTRVYGADAGAESLRSTSIQLGKALNDPVANLGALGRVGIQFTKAQKATIKSLQEGGNKAAAQNIILEELEKQYGGSAKAAAKAGTGGFKQLQNTMGDISEVIGKRLNKSLQKFLPGMKRAANAVKRFVRIPLKRKLTDEFVAVNRLTSELANSNISQGRRLEIYEELKRINPDIVKGVDKEKFSIDSLRSSLRKYNEEQIKKIAIADSEEDLADSREDLGNKTARRIEDEIKLREILAEAAIKAGEVDAAAGKRIAEALESDADLDTQTKQIQDIISGNKRISALNTDIIDQRRKLIRTRHAERVEQGQFNKSLSEYEKRYNAIFGLQNKVGGLGVDGDGTPDPLDDESKELLSKTFKAEAPKVFNINIDSLIEEFSISTTNLKEGTEETKNQILVALTQALNEAQTIAG